MIAARQATDARLIIAARGLRSFGYGLLAVLLGVALSAVGFSPVAIGAIITISLVGDFCSTYLIGLFADRWGRRRTLAVLAILMAVTGAIFGLTHLYPVLVIAAFFGTLGTSASETAPFLPIDQAMLPQTCAPERRTAVFARYNIVASLGMAGGSLAAGLPDLLARAGLPSALGLRLMFGVYTAAALCVLLLVLRLSSGVETPSNGVTTKASRWRRLVPPLGRSRGNVLRLAGLFSVDAVSSGLIVRSLMALFFHLRYGVPLAALGALFFVMYLLSALSSVVAVHMARRFGLLNTMVFAHLPTHALLMLVPLMPTFPLAAALLLLRQVFSSVDVPTRQAYTMALVAPEERTAAASVTSLARSAGSSISPVFAGLLLQGPLLVLGLPFVASGIIKVVYDLSLWGVFRRVPLDEVPESVQA